MHTENETATMRYMLSYEICGLSSNWTFDTLDELKEWAKEKNIARGTIFTYIPTGYINQLTEFGKLEEIKCE